jgi:hypothetical protein
MSENRRFNPANVTKQEICDELDRLSGIVSGLEAVTEVRISEKIAAESWKLRVLEKMFETLLANTLPHFQQSDDIMEAIILDAKKFISDSKEKIINDKYFDADDYFINHLLEWIEQLPNRIQHSEAYL